MRRFALVLSIISIAAPIIWAAPFSEQVTRPGRIIHDGEAVDGPLVVRPVDRATGTATGTMATETVQAVAAALRGVATFAVVEPAGVKDGARFPKQDANSPSIRTAEVSASALAVLGLKVATGRGFQVADQKARQIAAIAVEGPWLGGAGLGAGAVGAVGTLQRGGQAFAIRIVGTLSSSAVNSAPELDPATQLVIVKTDPLQSVTESTLSFAPLIRPLPAAQIKDVRSRLNALAAQLSKQTGAAGISFRLESYRRK